MSKSIILMLAVLVFVVALIVVSTIANFQFSKRISKEVKDLYSVTENRHEIVRESDLLGLPRPVQSWLRNSNVVGKEKVVTVRTRQEVSMRLKPESSWLKAEVEQYFRTDEPGFIWAVDIKMAPLFHIVGRDQYIEGKGHMLIKLLSLKTVADGKGKEVDQGTLLRYLAEMMWFPSAAISPYIQWEEIDVTSAKATMSYKGVTASAVFNFNAKGEVSNLVAQRYGDFDGEYRMETWSVVAQRYEEFNGINIPAEGELIWKLKKGDFHWYHFKVKEMEYNQPTRFQ